MRDKGLRGDNRNDPVAQAVAADPQIAVAIDEQRVATMQGCIDKALQGVEDKKLTGWVTVAVWEDSEGGVSHTVIGDGHSSPLELKGYLHDGVWTAAHAE